MRVTWLFGNGLDLSYGLKTSYHHFYDYLLRKEDEFNLSSNGIFNQLKKDFENHQEDLWSDYEIRLGQLTSNLSENQLEQFETEKIEIDLLLKEHLIEENNNLKLTTEESEQILRKSFSELEHLSKEIDNQKIKILVQKNSNSPLRFRAISFNYTDLVSLLWGEDQNLVSNLRLYGFTFSNSCILELPFYLHGTLDDGEMIVGINDPSQIESEKLRKNTDLQDTLIKSNLLENAGQLHFQHFKDIINQSELICTYGLSLGASDAQYWEVIKQKLLEI